MDGLRNTIGPDGYRLVLPEGWIRLNVRGDVDKTIREAIAHSPIDTLPRDERPKRRAALEGRLRLAINNAKKIDAYAMYVPLKGMHGLAIPASFMVAAATDFSGGGPEQDVLDQLLSAPGAQPVVLDGSDAVRTESVVSGSDEDLEHEIQARQVSYTVAVPGTQEWLIVLFDVLLGDGSDEEYDKLVEALTFLFDSIMTTFRWQFSD